jgi:hypothetical protein
MTIYAVNGKEPVAAWIPSLDTAGNGTTTLTDLVGSNNGTLTNMDAATDWVADTDAGGVRALDFDGVNDRVSLGSAIVLSAPFTVSVWAEIYSTGNTTLLGDNTTTNSFFLSSFSSRVRARTVSGVQVQSAIITSNTGWHHIMAVCNAANLVTLYVDGSSTGTPATATSPATNISTIGCASQINQFIAMRTDDIRIFTAALDATDIAYLYNSGNGRGRVVDPAPTGVTYHPLSSRSTHPLRFSI